MLRLLIIFAFVFALCLVGCQSTGSPRDTYRTADQDPVRNADTARRLHNRALELIADGKAESAMATLRRALEADITFGPAHNNLGKLLFDQGKLYAAAWEFQYAIKLMPHQPEPKNNLGLVLERAGKLDDAIETYRKAVDLEPDNPVLIGNLARCKHRRGDKDNEQRRLLQELVMKDTRPDWRQWAQEQLRRL